MDAAKKLDVEHAKGKNGTPESPPTPRILLVDEHVVTAEIERSYLIGVGFDVALATEADEAQKLIGSQSFDLIMVDTGFRGDQGVETLKALKSKSKNPEVKSIVTGLSFPPPLKKKVREAGADELFVKPAPRPQVLKEIKKLTSSASRNNERVAHVLSLVLKWEDSILSCQTLDLSSDGVHLSLVNKSRQNLQPPPVGAKVEMDIQLTEKDGLSRVMGEVMRHTKEGFGVRFTHLKKSDQKKLDKYMLRHSLEQAASHYYL